MAFQCNIPNFWHRWTTMWHNMLPRCSLLMSGTYWSFITLVWTTLVTWRVPWVPWLVLSYERWIPSSGIFTSPLRPRWVKGHCASFTALISHMFHVFHFVINLITGNIIIIIIDRHHQSSEGQRPVLAFSFHLCLLFSILVNPSKFQSFHFVLYLL